MKVFKIIVIGESWHGSDCTGLARGFRELGHTVDLIGTDQFLPKAGGQFWGKVSRRLLSRHYRSLFNDYIVKTLTDIKPDLVVVFKGNYVSVETLVHIRSSGAWLCNFYPDVSAYGHPNLDTKIFSSFDHIFTTKTFGVADFRNNMGLANVSFLPHGFDPSVHRPILPDSLGTRETIDVSFIGTWSPHKNRILNSVTNRFSELSICIWGSQWEKSDRPNVGRFALHRPVFGDFYAQAIGMSKINLGLLSERRVGASSGDQITSRTFHIPASGGFMLHERTSEVLEYYIEGKEIACFDGEDELNEKISYYLSHEVERIAIAKAGYVRCLKENSLSKRAESILEKYRLQRIDP